jgi:hypothetical protein
MNVWSFNHPNSGDHKTLVLIRIFTKMYSLYLLSSQSTITTSAHLPVFRVKKDPMTFKKKCIFAVFLSGDIIHETAITSLYTVRFQSPVKTLE